MTTFYIFHAFFCSHFIAEFAFIALKSLHHPSYLSIYGLLICFHTGYFVDWIHLQNNKMSIRLPVVGMFEIYNLCVTCL